MQPVPPPPPQKPWTSRNTAEVNFLQIHPTLHILSNLFHSSLDSWMAATRTANSPGTCQSFTQTHHRGSAFTHLAFHTHSNKHHSRPVVSAHVMVMFAGAEQFEAELHRLNGVSWNSDPKIFIREGYFLLFCPLTEHQKLLRQSCIFTHVKCAFHLSLVFSLKCQKIVTYCPHKYHNIIV